MAASIDTPLVGRETGQVKWFNDKIGFGFITLVLGTQKGSDVFVHHSGIHPRSGNHYRSLRKGEYVNFDVISGSDGKPQAVHVTGIAGGDLMCDVLPRRRSRPESAPAPEPQPEPEAAESSVF